MNNFRLMSILLSIFLILPFTYSLNYYIEEKITVLEDGNANIEGTTNIDFLSDLHPIKESINGVTSDLTSKKGKYWLFSLIPKTNISATFIEINLPKGAVINYINSQLQPSISTKNDIITAKFSGQNKNSDITIQYTLGESPSFSIPWSEFFIGFTVILLLSLLVFLVSTFLLKSKSSNKEKIDLNKINTIKPTLNETQIKIIDALIEKKGSSSQTAIQYMSGIPKSSLSRNIELLSQKEIIQKFYNGTTNHLKIHPSYKK